MRNKILLIFLIISLGAIFGGCSLVSPFKPINSCTDSKDNGANCASVESNLNYSINNGSTVAEPDESEKDVNDNETVVIPHNEETIMKDEIVRLMAAMSIDTNVTKNPTLIPRSSYRVLIFPYSGGDKFYSARYVYITAGKPRWVAGNYIISESNPVKIDTPQPVRKAENRVMSVSDTALNQKPMPVNAESELKPEPEKEVQKVIASVKHRVNAYLLNCRDMPSIDGNSVAVFDQDKVLDVIDKSQEWWEVNYYDMQCFVNPKYLYSEPVE